MSDSDNDNYLIKWLDNITSQDAQFVGGKARHLGQLVEFGIRVPRGFCITTQAFETIVRSLKMQDTIDRLYHTLSEGKASSELIFSIHQTISLGPIPEFLGASILRAYHQLGNSEAQKVAVRSSATAEDLPTSSLAGQFYTAINVCEDESVLNAVRRCWASLFNQGVFAYIDVFGIDPRDLKMAVIIQSQVNADKSGVMFTAHPVTQDRDKLLIEANYGLGLSTVGGIGNQDRYIISKTKMKTVDTQIGRKTHKIVPLATEDVEKVTVPRAAQSQPSLNEKDIEDLVRLGLRIERHFGCPQDIEWAISNGDVYILQTRDITSLQ